MHIPEFWRWQVMGRVCHSASCEDQRPPNIPMGELLPQWVLICLLLTTG